VAAFSIATNLDLFYNASDKSSVLMKALSHDPAEMYPLA